MADPKGPSIGGGIYVGPGGLIPSGGEGVIHFSSIKPGYILDTIANPDFVNIQPETVLTGIPIMPVHDLQAEPEDYQLDHLLDKLQVDAAAARVASRELLLSLVSPFRG